jgi:beta-lactamase class D
MRLRPKQRLTPRQRRRLRRVATRTVPAVIVLVGGVGAVVAGVVHLVGAPGRDQRAIVRSYVSEWSHDEYRAMWSQLSPASRHRVSETEFAAELSDAAQTGTLDTIGPGRLLSIAGHTARVELTIRTTVFGRLREVAVIPLSGSGSDTRIVFSTSLLFPGLEPGELLSRRSVLGSRGTLLAADGEVLAQGRSLATPIPQVAGAIVGTIGPIPAGQATLYAQQGYPAGARVGQDGLEEIFQRQLAGRLGGKLFAGTRLLATAKPRAGVRVRTSIVPNLELAALDALDGRYGGITVMNPRTGAVEAAAGIAFSAVQAPGSTFKIITSSAALQAGLTTPQTVYPYVSKIQIDGFTLHNADNELCGGTLTNAFAASCDTTFAPIGDQLGANRLVSAAERFGFDEPTGLLGAEESTIPSPADLGGPVGIGASAIGQGLVQATTLEMADVAAAIAERGRRPLPTMLARAKPRYVRATTRKVAAEVAQMMEAVVEYGTGTTAQIPGVTVAGKTGTAELKSTAGKKNDVKATDSWFVGYAPAGDPKVVVCALFPDQGFGAATAAPAVRQVIEAALGIT